MVPKLSEACRLGGYVLDLIVSVCHPKHLIAWRAAQERTSRFIPSREHVLVVPDDSAEEFSEATNGSIKVEPESLHIAPYEDRLRYELRRIGEERRYGSYVQQLIKLGALRGRPDGERLLIWDADTVPLRNLEFFMADGRVRFFAEHRAHEPIFVQVERALGLQKATKRSFIAQCFPIRSEWANAFFAVLEESGQPWYTRIISSIPFDRGSALSEYELLGTFIADRFGEHIKWTSDPWLRNGYRFARIDGDSVDLSKVPSDVYFLALEDYDRPEVNSRSVSVDTSFEPTTARNRRIRAALAEACSRLILTERQTKLDQRVLFVGLGREAEALVPVGELRASRAVVSVVSAEDVEASAWWSRFIHGIPAAEDGQQEVFVLDAGRSLLVSPRLTHLACRFWTELVDWDDEDVVARRQLEAARRVSVPAISWGALLDDDPSVVVIALPGFEHEVLGSLVACLEQRGSLLPDRLGVVSTYRDAALFSRLAALGYDLVFSSTEPDAAEHVLWAFERSLGIQASSRRSRLAG